MSLACKVPNSFFKKSWKCRMEFQTFAVFSTVHGMPARTSDEKGVCPSNACIVTKRKKVISRFLYHTKDNFPSFLRRRMVGGATTST